MGLIARNYYKIQFALGKYQLRQITKIERGGIVIDQLRYEQPPDAWLHYLYLFFPRWCRDETYHKDFRNFELCYDYYDKNGCTGPHSAGGGKNFYYALFKNEKTTGYIIREYYSEGRRSYSVIHINEFGARKYDSLKNGTVKQIYYAMTEEEAAICMLEDIGDFEPIKIDMNLLAKECENTEQYPGSCILYLKLAELLTKCNHSNNYLT